MYDSPSLDLPSSLKDKSLHIEPQVQSQAQIPKKLSRRHDTRLIVITIVTLFLLAVSFGYFLLTGPFASLTSASIQNVPSDEKSLLFVFPLTIKADGTESTTVQIFVSDKDGKPLANQVVAVQAPNAVFLPSNQATSDETGKTSFTMTLNKPGLSKVTYSVNNVAFSKSLTVMGE